VLIAALIALMVACGGGGGGTTTTPPPVISVSLAGAPASLLTNGAAALTAAVANDSANAGVTWSVTCGSTGTGACGAFSNITSASATYTAPLTAPTGNTVTVTATSVTDPTRSASSMIGIVTTVVVILSPAPTSLQLSTGAAFTAFVANDSANAGVTWTVTCGSTGACGSLSAVATASGTTNDFSAPGAIPTGNTVTVTATSVTDATKSASAKITITTANTTLANGTYVFSLAGATGGGPYYVAGAFTVSGGTITSGEQDYIDLGTIASDKINGTGSGLSTTSDGNLLITLTTCNGTDCTSTDTNVGVSGVEGLDAAMFSTTRARIIEFDSNATSGGRVDLQTSTAAPSAGYAFVTSGVDAHAIPLAIGGVLNIDGSGTISGAGSVFDFNDSFFDGGLVLQKQSFTASTISAADGFGRVVFNLVPSSSSGISAINLVGYIVDTTHIRLIETGDSLNATIAGIALGQGANTGTFTDISGNSYVAGLSGFEGIGGFQAAGVFTTNSSGSVSGAMNYNDFTGIGPETPSPITHGTFIGDSTGRVTMTGVTDGLETFNLQLYLTANGPGSEAATLSMDNNDVLAGLAYQQTGGGSFTAPSFFGAYALDVMGVDISGNELNAVGPITADGAGTLTGSVDLNDLDTGANTVLPVLGSFSAASSGVSAGTLTGVDVTTSTNQDVFSYYVIDTTKILAIETDQKQLTLSVFTLEQ
jgi:hypothetical protein